MSVFSDNFDTNYDGALNPGEQAAEADDFLRTIDEENSIEPGPDYEDFEYDERS